jgi:serine/threonine-protein kinase
MPEWNVPGYTEMHRLGSGGFGEVVLARHDTSGTLVAIKYLHQDLLADPEFAELFRGEATVLASLDDPDIVRLYEYVESPSGAAIVMELIDGVSVRDILSHRGATTAEAALVVLQGSLLGLAAAHRHGVVHRDYKPENVLVNGQGVSKLTDFGIAVRAGDRPIPAGTLAYAPPEQFGGTPASPAGDVYAATATFYECLTGHPPFTGDSAARLLYQHLSEPVPLQPVPEPLRPLVTAGMAKNPSDRPTDAAAFVTELRAVAADACGPDWEDRGRSHLGEAALLLAALWPSGAAPAVQGSAAEKLSLSRQPDDSAQPKDPSQPKHSTQPKDSSEPRHLQHIRHTEHIRHLEHLRRFGYLRVAMAVAAAAAVVAAGTALAATRSPSSRPTAADHPLAVQPISLQPTGTQTTLASTSLSPSPTSASPSPSATPSLSASPSLSAAPSLSASPSPLAAPSPSARPSPSAKTSSSSSPSSSPSACTPAITGVGAFGATGTQTVQITGSCFGAGNTSSGADTAYFRISDLTAGWNACWTGDPGTDLVTCDISAWTGNQIIFSGFTGDYGQANYVVAEGDDIEVQVWNPHSGKGPAICHVVAGSGVPAHC